MDVPLEGILATFQAVAAATSFADTLTSLAARTGLGQRITEWLGADPQRREFTKAWEAARTRFAQEYPEEANTFFTRERLQTIVPRFLERYQDEVRTEAFAEHLAVVWAETLPSIIMNDLQDKLQHAATRFLALLDEELGRQPSFRELMKVYILQEISRSSAETSTNTSDILKELRTLNDRQALPASPDALAHNITEIDTTQTVTTVSIPVDDLALTPPANFQGRQSEVEWALDRLRRFGSCFCSLHGLGGVGKTALAATIIQRARHESRFQGGVAVVNCGDILDAEEALRVALSRFYPPSVLAGRSVPELTSIASQCLSGKDVMVVLDDVSPDLDCATAVQPLLNVGATVLATSRHSLPASIGGPEARLEVGLLPQDDALKLFATTLGRQGLAELSEAEYNAATAIVQELERHTLAVKLAAAYARDYSRDLTVLAEELQTPERALHLPEDGEYSAVATAFAHSIEHLDTHVRRLFIALAAFGTPEFSRNSVIVLGIQFGLTQVQAEQAIDTLIHRALASAWTDTTMPNESHRERLQLHPLLAAFVGREFSAWPEDERRMALQAVAIYYRYYVENRPGAALARDEANIISALSWAIDEKVAPVVAPICMRMQYLWQRNSNIAAAIRFLPAGAGAAIFLADHTADVNTKLFAAAQLLGLGQLLVSIQHNEEATSALTQAVDRFKSLNNLKGQGAALVALAQVELGKGELDRAEDLCSEAQKLFAEADDMEGDASAFHMLANISLVRRDYDGAQEREMEALELFRELGLEREEGIVLVELADIANSKGNFEGCLQYLQAAVTILRRSGTRMDLASCLHRLGRLTLHQSSTSSGRVSPSADVLARRAQEAAVYFHEVLALLWGTLNFDAYADAAYELAVIHLLIARTDIDKEANLELSRQYDELALEATRKGHHHRLVACLVHLGEVALQQGKKKEAERKYREAFKQVHMRQDTLGIAVLSRDFGGLLVTRFGKREEGCQLLAGAVQQFNRLGRQHDADNAYELRRRLCGGRKH